MKHQGYNNLANAIIESAASDYKRYVKKINRDWRKMEDVEKKDYACKILYLERFLTSPYGMLLSHNLGGVILEKLQKELKVNVKEAFL